MLNKQDQKVKKEEKKEEKEKVSSIQPESKTPEVKKPSRVIVDMAYQD